VQAKWTVFGWISAVLLPSFVIGTIFSVFHLIGKHHLSRHWLYIAVTSLGSLLKVHTKIPLVIPSITGVCVCMYVLCVCMYVIFL
jgi:hypothetical protein